MTPAEFAQQLKICVQGQLTVFTPIPKNKRPFYQQVIEQFEKDGVCYSPSGLTAQIVCMYLAENKRGYTLTFNPNERGFVVVQHPERQNG